MAVAHWPRDGSRLTWRTYKGEKTLLVVGKYTYKDAVGRHTYDLCDWLQAPVNTAQPIWHYCHVHQK